jgi:hypothetical protein
MSTQTSLERTGATSRLRLVESPGDISSDAISQALAGIESLTHAGTEDTAFIPEDDCLGCMRGMAVVFAINVVILGLGCLGWTLWRLLR